MANLTNAGWGQAINRAAKECGAKTLFKGVLGNLTISYAGLEVLSYLTSQGASRKRLAMLGIWLAMASRSHRSGRRWPDHSLRCHCGGCSAKFPEGPRD